MKTLSERLRCARLALPSSVRLCVWICATLLTASTATATFAQSAAPVPSAASTDVVDIAQPYVPQNGGVSHEPHEVAQDSAAENEKARLAVNPVTGVATSSGAGYEPLTGRERWKLYWKQNYYSIGAYFGPVFTALVLDQAANSPQQWGGGFEGYGRRVASRVGFSIAQGTFQAPVAALLHEDVRYIASPRPETKHRILHAIAFDFVTYNERGHVTPNVAYLGSNFAAAAAARSWVPANQSLGRYALITGSEQIGLNMGVNLLQEFWTEATHLLSRHHVDSTVVTSQPSHHS